MSRIRGVDTKPEITVRRWLHARGFRYRLHRRDLPGRPDIAFPRLRAVVFVNGCFWHGHRNCTLARLPKSHVEFWASKIEANRRRDSSAVARLRKMGWAVFVVWECQIEGSEKKEKTLNRLAYALRRREVSL